MDRLRSGVCAAFLTGLVCLVLACGDGGKGAENEHEKGRQLFARNGCAVCHGDSGRGDGRLATTLKPPPRDFRDIMAYKKGRDVASIVQTIGKGVAGTSMPAFAHITEADRTALAKYIVHLQQKP